MAPHSDRHSAVETAREALQQEHRVLNLLLDRIKDTHNASALRPLLAELHPHLMEHFGHEEFPGGLYQNIGACTAEHRESLRALLDEHFRFLAVCHGLIRSTQSLDPTSQDRAEGVVRQAHQLVEALYAHEAREIELAAACSNVVALR